MSDVDVMDVLVHEAVNAPPDVRSKDPPLVRLIDPVPVFVRDRVPAVPELRCNCA
jgi:hypothetical protein